MGTLVFVFLVKFFDCTLSVLKTLFLIKSRFFISSVLNSLSAVLFVFVADTMVNASGEMKGWIAFVIFLANLTGGYFPSKVLDNLEGDRLFVFVVTAPSLDKGIALADNFRKCGLPVSTAIIYGKDVEKTLSIKVYAENKEDSKIISSYLTEDFKWHIVEAV